MNPPIPLFVLLSGHRDNWLSAFEVYEQQGMSVLALQGDWTIDHIAAQEKALSKLVFSDAALAVDVTQLGLIDTAGAFAIIRAISPENLSLEDSVEIRGDHPQAATMFRLVSDAAKRGEHNKAEGFSVIGLLARIGEGAVDFLKESAETFSFIGQSLVATVRLLFTPHKIRWTSVVAVMEEAGLNALPIVVFLSFFVGMVIAFIGATILQQTVGATVFTIDLVGWSVLREFGVILTGILLAGRTNSSFTAQIGSMRMRQEIDAMRTLGLDPIEVLVVPRILAMLVMTPFLTFAATIAGIFGGLMVSWLALDISPVLFLTRMQEVIPISSFWVGMSKTPVIALIVAVIACRQGLQVEGNVQSLGRATTASVVHAIFLIIVADAVFAMIYLELDI